jgi:two-component system phosphate regulon sensor histidine kinase PhoR
MRTRIFWKFFAGFLAMSLFLALTFYFLTVGQVRSFYMKTCEEHLQKLGTLLRTELTAIWPGSGPEALERFIQAKGRQAQTRITVIDRQGKVLADSQKDPLLMQNHSDRPEFAAALSGQPRSALRFSFTLRESMLYFAMPLQVGGKTVGALRLSLFFKAIEQEFSPWHWKITVVLLALLGLSLLFSLLLSSNLARPIRGLAQAARHVASGDLDSHIPSRRQDELGQLIADFNFMVDSQKSMVGELRYGRQELETILASLSDGLLVINSGEKIVRAGPSFCRLINDSAPVGKPFWEVLRRADFADLVRKAGERSIHSELEIHDQTYFVSLSPLPDNGGTVVTFHDLSESKRLERQKKDFVANVSHELRTPLTAIKGYAETLAEDAAGDSRKYLEVILRHADRLIDLTRDLLSLAELEEKGAGLHREAIDWQELLAGIGILFEKKLLDKNLKLDISLPENLGQIAFQGDRFRLEQMFINLLDNAVKYTDQGGIAIRISAEAGPEGPRRGGPEVLRDGCLRIDIRDSGVGMAAEHLPRIFERFYVVDKARSRQSGGTGLGLAIVKHIVSLHGGRIEVQSSPGTGCTFTIRLPFVP